uniref:ATP-dependent Clp protease proteolytic subunit n=1 Tax=Mitostemma brevifilis TaxID=197922 RepID=A0A7H0TVV5_9ROSI|nr:ClpP [Mitostemma brevifilis]QNR05157.1 ClpP [Mitostemma brevifilis]
MPIGVPKVPFRLPGEEDATWVDTGLYNQRILFLCQEVNSEISNQIAGLLIYLNIEDPTKEFFLFINSPGGWILPGMTIYNTMEMVNSDVRTICTGIAASMASFVLVAGDSFKRLAFPNARVMIHQPRGAFLEENTSELVMEMEELMIIRENIAKIYARKTGQPLGIIVADLERDSFMSATEAQAHGIVDFIGMWDS